MTDTSTPMPPRPRGGGPRPNAGRKPRPVEEHRRRYEIYFDPRMADFVEAKSGAERGAVSRYIATLVHKAMIEEIIETQIL